MLGHNLSPFLPFLVCSLPYKYWAEMHLSMSNFAKKKNQGEVMLPNGVKVKVLGFVVLWNVA